MKLFFKYLGVTFFLMLAWFAIVFFGTQKGWWHQPITPQKTPQAFVDAAKKEIDKGFVGNFAMATFKNGEVENEEFHSVGEPVNKTTVFQVASLSKWVSAIGVMKLVEDGKLNLDAPVSTYLTRWQLPQSSFNNEEVTVRRLLSHTSGLTDGLGYSGFKEGEQPQTIEASLTKAIDADEGVSGEVKIGITPGSEFKYSGGGYTLLQLLVEEVTGQSFDEYMKTSIFEPLHMLQSSYTWDESSGYDLA